MSDKFAKTATELGGNFPTHIPYQVCPICDHVHYWRKEPFGPNGCNCRHDPANGPQPGDSIVLTGDGDPYYVEMRHNRIVVDNDPGWLPGNVHLCLGAMIPYRGASGHVDISGGPFVMVDTSIFHYAGDRRASFWKWNQSGPGKDQGEYYYLTLPVWEVSISDLERSAREKWAEFSRMVDEQ